MPKYFVTFGPQYANEPHPHWAGANPEGFIEVTADSEIEARIDIASVIADKWNFIFHEKEFKPDFYPAGRLATIEEIKKQVKDQPVNTLPEGQLKMSAMKSEGEKKLTLTAPQMMIMNNVANLFNRCASFPRVDKFEFELEVCVKNILAGFGITKETPLPGHMSLFEVNTTGQSMEKIRGTIRELLKEVYKY